MPINNVNAVNAIVYESEQLCLDIFAILFCIPIFLLIALSVPL